MADDTRRAIVQSLIDRGVTQFALRPLDGPEELRQEILILSGYEATWSLPCCDPLPLPAPVGTKMQTTGAPVGTKMQTTGALNVRDAPSVLGTVKGVLAQGTVIVVGEVSLGWRAIVDGAYKGCYVSDKYLKSPQ